MEITIKVMITEEEFSNIRGYDKWVGEDGTVYLEDENGNTKYSATKSNTPGILDMLIHTY